MNVTFLILQQFSKLLKKPWKSRQNKTNIYITTSAGKNRFLKNQTTARPNPWICQISVGMLSCIRIGFNINTCVQSVQVIIVFLLRPIINSSQFGIQKYCTANLYI